ncbi:MAG: TlpA family protein disulfide reductase [Candidatus Thorarchaeota archaeon]|jgi:peroxiredoxin
MLLLLSLLACKNETEFPKPKTVSETPALTAEPAPEAVHEAQYQEQDTEKRDTAVEPCLNYVNHYACDLVLTDQYGKTFSLYDNLGKRAVVLDFSTAWCGPCNIAASHTQATQDTYGLENLTYVIVLLQNNYREDPSLKDVQEYATHHSITTAKVLQGATALADMSGTEGWPIQYVPTFFFIDESMRIQSAFIGWNEDAVNAHIEKLF